MQRTGSPHTHNIRLLYYCCWAYISDCLRKHTCNPALSSTSFWILFYLLWEQPVCVYMPKLSIPLLSFLCFVTLHTRFVPFSTFKTIEINMILFKFAKYMRYIKFVNQIDILRVNFSPYKYESTWHEVCSVTRDTVTEWNASSTIYSIAHTILLSSFCIQILFHAIQSRKIDQTLEQLIIFTPNENR